MVFFLLYWSLTLNALNLIVRNLFHKYIMNQYQQDRPYKNPYNFYSLNDINCKSFSQNNYQKDYHNEEGSYFFTAFNQPYYKMQIVTQFSIIIFVMETIKKEKKNQQGDFNSNQPFLQHRKNISQQSFDQFLTPVFTQKYRRIAATFEETKKLKMKRRDFQGQHRWVYKTQMKVVSDHPPTIASESLKKDATLSKVKTYIKASQDKLQRQVKALEDKRNIIYERIKTLAEAKSLNRFLKKQIINFDLDRARLKFILSKTKQITARIYQSQQQILETGQKIIDMKKQTQEYQCLTTYSQKNTKLYHFIIEELKKEIQQKSSQNKKKNLLLQQISTKKMPNQKEVNSCMFLVGILNQQLYLLQLEKSLKQSILPSDLQLKKVKKEQKPKDTSGKKIPKEELNEHLFNRIINIDCSKNQTFVFKVLTVIYMHCKTLFFNNSISIMRKTSFFSEQFKQIYDFQQFSKYMHKLIGRYMGNVKNSHEMQSCQKELNPVKQNEFTLLVVSNQSDTRYLNWIMKSFDNIKENKFMLRIGSMQILIQLLAIEQLSRRLWSGEIVWNPRENAILKINLHKLNKDTTFI